MSSRDLQGCAQLLGQFLDADKTKSAQTQSYLKSLRKEKTVTVKGKSKSRKGRSQVKKQTATTLPPNVDKVDEDIQRMIRIKRAREGHPILNEKQKQELPTKDPDASDITAPYNQRLLSSTPHDTPVKIAGKASVSTLLQGDVGEHALNSFEYIKNINPPKESPRPKLKEGQVDYIAHPHMVTTASRGSFTQEHLEGMRQAYMSCLTDTQLRQHQAVSQAANQKTNFPSTIPQPIVLSGPNPTVLYPASHLIQPANANVAAQIGGYNLTQPHQNGDVHHLTMTTGTSTTGTNDYSPNYYVISGSGGMPASTAEGTKPHVPVSGNKYNVPLQSTDSQVVREPAEKESGQYSLYSTNTSLPQQENPVNYSDAKDHVADHRTISPFKPDEPREPVQQVSRKEMIKSALKIALDDNGYLKSGPISPFKAGTKGFSACVNQSEGSVGMSEKDVGGKEREVDPGMEDIEGEVEEADNTLIGSNPSSREPSPKPKGQKAKGVSGKEQGEKESEKSRELGTKSSKPDSKRNNTASRNKKVQFVPSKKKGKDVRAVRKVTTNGKSAVPTASAESVKMKNGKTKGKSQEEKEDDGKVVSKQEENKENLHPQDTVTKETDVGKSGEFSVVDVSKYSGTMKKIQHLVKEVRAVPGIKLDKEGKRLLKELNDAVHTGTNNWQTDLDLALQPIRSENAQLRRKVRILTQQLKDKERDLESAEKPDPNFLAAKTARMTVVHLQVKLFNAENEAKAVRATNAKLKEDMRLYLCQLEKLSAERAELLNLFGKKNTSSGSGSLKVTPVPSREPERGGSVCTELDTYKRQKQAWDKEKEELVQGRQAIQLSLKEKEAELANMQELVRSLQGSMMRLLEDLQTSKPHPNQSVDRLNRELDHVQSIINSREQLRQSKPPSDPAAPIPYTFRPGADQANLRSRQARSASIERPTDVDRVRAVEKQPRIRVPERRAVSQHREPQEKPSQLQVRKPAHRSASDLGRRVENGEKDRVVKKNLDLYSREEIDQIYREEQDRWDKDVMPRTYTRSKASPRQHSQDTDTGVGGEEMYKAAKSPRIPKTHPTEKVGLYLMDQPGVNINKMAQSLSTGGAQPQRVSMSTNPETDITDYNMFPGMSPMKGSAFSKLDPFIRDVIVNKKTGGEVSQDQREMSPAEYKGHHHDYGQNKEAYLKSHSVPIFGQEKIKALTDGDGKADLHPVIPVAGPISSRTSESRDTVSSAPTVKELLTPLADRMERFRSMTEVKKSGAMRAINFDVDEGGRGSQNMDNTKKGGATLGDKKKSSGPSGTPKVDLDDTYNMDLEGELEKLQYEVSSEDTSTFSEVDDPQALTAQELAVSNNKGSENPNQSESRYSVTDYFKKYPQKSAPGGGIVLSGSGCIEEQDPLEIHPGGMETDQRHLGSGKTKNAWSREQSEGPVAGDNCVFERLNLPSDEEEDQWVEKVIFSPNGIPMIFDDTNDEIESIEVNIDDDQIAAEFRNLRDLSDKEEVGEDDSSQKELYKGTDLDTSLSSINKDDSIGTATTTTSISSVDDRVFRQGLANLDANIARVQQSLRQKLY